MRSLRRRGRRKGDYAPSRLAWKLERMWMDPRWRRLVKTGIPSLAAALAIGVTLADHGRASALVAWGVGVKRAFEDRPEFAVIAFEVSGAGPELKAQLAALAAPVLPDSSLRLDLPALRARMLDLPRLAAVVIAVTGEGTLTIRATEHPEAALHRARDGLYILRGDGTRLMGVPSRLSRPRLPVLAGDHADEAVGEALGVLGAAGPLRDRIVGLVRVGGRRWDAVLTTGQRILLPESGAANAIRLAAELDEVGDIIARGVTHIDLRRPERPVLRLTEAAAEALHAARQPAKKETTEG